MDDDCDDDDDDDVGVDAGVVAFAASVAEHWLWMLSQQLWLLLVWPHWHWGIVAKVDVSAGGSIVAMCWHSYANVNDQSGQQQQCYVDAVIDVGDAVAAVAAADVVAAAVALFVDVPLLNSTVQQQPQQHLLPMC